MDLFKHPYYRLNKLLMNLIGQWPNQNTLAKFCCRAVVIYFCVSEILCRTRTVYNNHDNADMIRDCTIEMFIQFGEITIFLCFMFNSQKTLELLNRIRMDWQVWAGEHEVNILHEYTELGKNINIAFAVVVYSVASLLMMQPVVEKIIDIYLKNGSEPGKFILMVDYYHVDEQKYYFYVVTYFNVASFAIGTPVLTNFIMLITYTQHSSGIFAALRYAHLIEAAYRWNLFITTGLGMILANGLGLLILIQTTSLQIMMTSLAIVTLMALCLLIECGASQILIEHSISISVYIHNSHWYNLSPKAQKLLQYMIMRCNVPCQLTAGNMFIMSIRTSWVMFKTAVSYFAFVRSTQGL